MDDLISRQDAMDALMPIYKSASLRNRNVFSTARKCMAAIEELPSAQPDCSDCIKHGGDWDCDHVHCRKGRLPSAQPKAGHWIEHEWAEETNGILISNYECSECHRWERYNSDFCPNCGTRMEE